MLVHLVLFRPKAQLAAEHREHLVAALERAHREIAAVRRFRIGRRTLRSASYAALSPDYPFLALIEFDDEASLREYLEHPAHAQLARLFWETSDAPLAYDYEVTDASALSGWLGPDA